MRPDTPSLGRCLSLTLTPSAVPLSTALGGTDKRIGSPGEGSPTFGAVALDTWVQFTICGPTLGVHAFPVPLPPVPRRRTMALPATRRPAEVHVPVVRKLLERKPPGAARTTLLGERLNHSRQVVV